MSNVKNLVLTFRSYNLLLHVGDIVPLLASQIFKGLEFNLIVSERNLLFMLTFLKKHIGFQYTLLSCISGIDLLKKGYRFVVSYDLLSLSYNSRIRVKTFINEYNYITSAVSVYINADWWEREIWDLFGIYFKNHPDLRRILTDYGFEGHPLRKDFPLCGFKELCYDNNLKTIIYSPVVFSQAFRLFDYETPW
jgi:NADH dehydrogenase (ubiquinone) Fe-S protein 3